MNCKQGDLAIYVGKPVVATSDITGKQKVVVSNGMIFRCVSPAVVLGKPGWNVEERDVYVRFVDGASFSGTIAAISDDCLRPVSGLGAADESATKKPEVIDQ